jgi:hypothetical protein
MPAFTTSFCLQVNRLGPTTSNCHPERLVSGAKDLALAAARSLKESRLSKKNGLSVQARVIREIRGKALAFTKYDLQTPNYGFPTTNYLLPPRHLY